MINRRINNKVLEITDNDKTVLSIAESFNDGVLNLTVSGQIRNDVAYEFEDELMAALSICPNIELDFGNVTYIASITMKSLLSAQQITDGIAGASIKIVNVRPEIMEIFKESGFTDILTITDQKQRR